MRHCENFKGNLTSEQVHRNNKLIKYNAWTCCGILIPSRRPVSLRGSISPSDFSVTETSEQFVYLPSDFPQIHSKGLWLSFGVYRSLCRFAAFSKIEEPSKTRLDFRTCGQYWLVQICGLQNRVPVRPIDFLHLAKWLGYNKFSWFTTLNSRNVVLFLP